MSCDIHNKKIFGKNRCENCQKIIDAVQKHGWIGYGKICSNLVAVPPEVEQVNSQLYDELFHSQKNDFILRITYREKRILVRNGMMVHRRNEILYYRLLKDLRKEHFNQDGTLPLSNPVLLYYNRDAETLDTCIPYDGDNAQKIKYSIIEVKIVENIRNRLVL